MTANVLIVAPHRCRDRCGATVIIALGALVILAAVAATVLRTVVPRYHVSFQTAGWQEARLAAEAGLDLALERLNGNVPDPAAATADWVGWKQSPSAAAKGPYLARSNASAVGGAAAENSVLVSKPIYLDNVNVSSAAGTVAAVDVQLWALYPSGPDNRNNVWFRVRSMGTASVPGPKRSAMDRMDTSLRRLSLYEPMRPRLAANDVLAPTEIPFPNASRIVEIIAKPMRPFGKAILTDAAMELGRSNGWEVNSYDSTDPLKSGPEGTYPGDDSHKIQSNGDIASNQANPTSTPYGPLIDANGATVMGSVSTNGGDDPSTAVHENVSDASGIDSNRISDDYQDPLSPPPLPTPHAYAPNPNYSTGVPFAASGSAGTDVFYRVAAKDPTLGGFTVTGTGRITIILDGDWQIGSGGTRFVEIPPDVQATIYVKGNVDFGNSRVNTTEASSKIPGNLLIYGVPDRNADGTLPVRTLGVSGNAQVAAAFYGPSYNVTMSGTTDWFGAVAAQSFRVNGGGNGGFHYDEALGSAGFIKRFAITSYFEDARQ